MSVWQDTDAVRITRDVQRLYELGPRPIYEFLAEVAADPGVRLNIEICLERYARLTPEMIDAVGARELRPPVFAVESDGVVAKQPAHPVRGAA